MDEHEQGMVTQIFNKVLLIFDYMNDNIGQEHILPVLSVIATVLFIVGVGYLMAYLVRVEEENVQKRQFKGNNNNNSSKLTHIKTLGTVLIDSIHCIKGSKTVGYIPELKLHDLRAEKYNGLVRLLKPGCRTIVLVTDLQSRSKLIPGYHKAVWPYRK